MAAKASDAVGHGSGDRSVESHRDKSGSADW